MTLQEAYAWASRRCSQREMCPADIATKLQEKGMAYDEIDEVIERLTQEKYLDTARYAKAFVHDKLLFQQWGRQKLQYLLRMKGIADADIRQAFEEIEEEEYLAVLQKVLRTKLRTLRTDDPHTAVQQLAAFAQRKGFELPLIFEQIKALKA